jgi:uncharacterized membrane-anchored protein YhcB (DUF1043 family)
MMPINVILINDILSKLNIGLLTIYSFINHNILIFIIGVIIFNKLLRMGNDIFQIKKTFDEYTIKNKIVIDEYTNICKTELINAIIDNNIKSNNKTELNYYICKTELNKCKIELDKCKTELNKCKTELDKCKTELDNIIIENSIIIENNIKLKKYIESQKHCFSKTINP